MRSHGIGGFGWEVRMIHDRHVIIVFHLRSLDAHCAINRRLGLDSQESHEAKSNNMYGARKKNRSLDIIFKFSEIPLKISSQLILNFVL